MFSGGGFKPSFGTGASNTFGASNSFGTTPTFGTSQTSAFGGTGTSFGAFGSTSNSGGGNTGGGGLFGATSTAPAFGSSNTTFGATPTFGTSTFGAVNSTPTFGSGGTSAFGATQPTSAFGASSTTPAFGAPASSSGFGLSTTPAFGTALNKPTFGATSPTTGFGGTTGGIFGGSQFPGSSTVSNNLGSLGGGGFSGWQQKPATTSPGQGIGFGTTFGGATTTPGFGTLGTTSSLGGGGAFGSLSKPGGTTSPITFGGLNRSASIMGTPSNLFGQPAANTAQGGGGFGFGLLGQQQQQQPQQQQQQQPAFGLGATSTLGGGGGFMTGFGQAQQSQSQGTGNPPFAATQIQDSMVKGHQTIKTNVNLQAITAMLPYNNKSFEELRLEDYKKGNKGGPAAGGGLGFGLNTASKPLFGTTSTPSFGATAGSTSASPFGATSNMFGAQNTTASSFGSTSTPSFGTGGGFSTATSTGTQPFSFGSSTTTSNIFGAPSTSTTTATPSFGFGSIQSTQQPQQQPSAFGSTFGAPSTSGFGVGTTNMFGGATTNQPTFGAPATSNLFSTTPSTGFNLGGTTAAKPATTGFGSFGTTTQTPSFGSFGSTPSTSTSGFGSSLGFSSFNTQASNQFKTGASTQPLFGTSATTPGTQQQPLFGGTFNAGGGFSSFGGQAGGFGTPTAGSMFGAPTQQNLLLQPQQQQQQQQQLQQQPIQLDVGDKIEFLLKKKDDLINSGQAQSTGASNSGGAADSNSGMSAPFHFTGFTGDVNFLGVPISHRTAARIVPRGMKTSARAKPTRSGNNATLNKEDARTTFDWTSHVQKPPVSIPTLESLSSPDLMYLGRNAKKLIIAPSPAIRDPSQGNAPKPDVTEGLPRHNIQKLYSAIPSNGDHSQSSGIADTPAKIDPSITHSAQSKAPTPSTHQKQKINGILSPGFGDATGLTPDGPVSTPSLDEKTSVSNREESDAMRLIYHRSPQVGSKNQIDTTSNPPILTLEGYWTSPDMSVLKQMPNSELIKVKDFVICRQDFGKIEWEGFTDVRGLNLDRIVRIDKKEVFVYEGVDNPPPIGKELNKNAIITLWNVFPKVGSDSDDSKAKFEAKLRKFCSANDCEYISYSSTTGEWVFAVKHFSRYGLDDSDDEDDAFDSNLPSQEMKVNKTDHFESTQKLPQDKQRVAASAAHMDVEEIDSFPAEGVERLRSILQGYALRKSGPQSPPQSVHGIFDETFRSPGSQLTENNNDAILGRSPIYATISPLKIGYSKSLLNAEIPSIDFDQLLDVSLPAPATRSFCMNTLTEIKSDIAARVGSAYQPLPDEVHTRLGLNKPSQCTQIKNYPLSLGRSFRVGWTPDGRLIQPFQGISQSNGNKSQSLLITKVDPLKWIRELPTTSDSNESLMTHFEPVLQAVLKCSHLEQVEGKESTAKEFEAYAPCWKSPRASEEATLRDEYLLYVNMLQTIIASYAERKVVRSHPDWTAFKAVQLINALYGQEASQSISNDTFMPFYEEGGVIPSDAVSFYSSEVFERRRMALSYWLKSAVAEEVASNDVADDGQFGRSGRTYVRLFELLSCQRIEDAVELAERAGLFRLATLLSQLFGDDSLRNLVRRQLELWQFNGGDTTIHPDLIRVYRLIGSDFYDNVTDMAEPSSILLGVGWLRTIASLYWYSGCNDTLASAIPAVSEAIKNYKLALEGGFVDPPFSRFTDNEEVDGLFSLMELLFPSEDINVLVSKEDIEMRVVRCLGSLGFGRDLMDVRTPFVLFTLLESLSALSNTSTAARLIRQDLIFQLLSEGKWHWAVFIALQIEDADERNAVAKDIVLRFAGEDNWEVAEGPNPAAFVTQSLSVPSQWLDEATAYRLGYSSSPSPSASGRVRVSPSPVWWGKVVYYLSRAGKTAQARKVLCEQIAPGAILRSKSASSELLTLLMEISSSSSSSSSRNVDSEQPLFTEEDGEEAAQLARDWNDKSDMLLQYLIIRDTFEAMKGATGEVNPEIGDDNEKDDNDHDKSGEEMDKDGVPEEGTVKVSDLKKIYFESVQLLRRLGNVYREEKRLIKVDGNGGQAEIGLLSRAMYFDMCTYLYRLVNKLTSIEDLLTSSEVVSDDFLALAPIFVETPFAE